MRRHKGYKQFPWFKHKKDCYCDSCFKHKCCNNKKQRAINIAKVNANNVDYFEYINSPLWYERKVKYYKKFQRQCRACGNIHDVDLHHMKYGEWGKEPDINLIPLCRQCHTEYHAIYKGRNSIQNVKDYISKKQEIIKQVKSIWKEFDSKNKKGV